MNEQEIRDRMEHLVDLWSTATPSQKLHLVLEKIRIEGQLRSRGESGNDDGVIRITHP